MSSMGGYEESHRSGADLALRADLEGSEGNKPRTVPRTVVHDEDGAHGAFACSCHQGREGQTG